MKMMLLAAAAALSLGSASAFANTYAPPAQHSAQYMYQQTQRPDQSFTYYAPHGSGVHWHPQRNTSWIGSSGNG